MNHLISMIHFDAVRLIGLGLTAFIAFAFGYWVLSRIIHNWHPTFQIAGIAVFSLLPLAATDQGISIYYGQACIGIASNRGFEWYRQIMYRRGFALF